MGRFKMVASGYVFFIRDDKILLLRRLNTGYEDGNYGLPAGHIEDNETLREGTCREIAEEVGIHLKPQDISLVHTMHRKQDDIRVDFFFRINNWRGNPKNMEPHKCDDLQWFPLHKLPTNTILYIRQAIINFENKIVYAEFGWS